MSRLLRPPRKLGEREAASDAVRELHRGLAIAALERAVALTGRGPHFVGLLGGGLAVAGRMAEARAILEELQARPPGSPTNLAEAWLLAPLGRIDEAFDVRARAEAELHTPFPASPGIRVSIRSARIRDSERC